MFPARIRAIAPSALVILALSGCPSWGCTDTTAERGEAGVRVRVVDTYGQSHGITAEVVDWSLDIHPQVPAEGDQLRFRFRFDGVGAYDHPSVDACAVDEKRVTLGCRTISSSQAFGPADGTASNRVPGHPADAQSSPAVVAGVTRSFRRLTTLSGP
ncbi:hypothetical protein ACFYUH_21055 [Streptomyces fimicarius]|uniref:hypothetical protein n=1 Tax=Streptomyces griseus TaxID=1911 RepID=UPI003690646B